MKRIIVLGLDGATWRILDRFVRDGTMPHLAKARQAGAWGNWRSTVPPFSAQAWVSLMTGRNPAKHGITDFWEAGDDRGQSAFVNSRLIQGEAIWDILSRQDKQIGVVNVPVTYPPPVVKGYVVSGLLTPSAAKDYTYPLALRGEIDAAVGAYEPDPYDPLRPGLELVKEFRYWMGQHEAAAQFLLQSHPADVFINVVQALDQLQHLFWNDIAALADGTAATRTETQEALRECYRAADEAIGHRLDALDDETTLFIISDHGFGPARSFFHANRFLAEHRFLTFAEQEANASQRIFQRLGLTQQRLKDSVRRADVLGLRRHVGRMARMGLARRLEAMAAIPLDWARTRAYAGSPASEGIFVNLRGREPHGWVLPGAEYEAVRDDILAALRELRDPGTGRPVLAHAWRREELYDGPSLPKMPDIIFSFGDQPYLASDSLSAPQTIAPIPSDYLQGRHCPEGIFLAVGAGIAPGVHVQGASVFDLVPTILHTLDLPLPDDLDGRPLTEVFSDGRRHTHEIRYETARPGPAEEAVQEPLYDADEAAAMQKRLQGLGYLG